MSVILVQHGRFVLVVFYKVEITQGFKQTNNTHHFEDEVTAMSVVGHCPKMGLVEGSNDGRVSIMMAVIMRCT